MKTGHPLEEKGEPWVMITSQAAMPLTGGKEKVYLGRIRKANRNVSVAIGIMKFCLQLRHSQNTKYYFNPHNFTFDV